MKNIQIFTSCLQTITAAQLDTSESEHVFPDEHSAVGIQAAAN